MLSLGSQQLYLSPRGWINALVLSSAVITTLVMTGCASKPQINNSVRYANAPDYYTVRAGDTLSGIAARYGLSYISVAEMNDIAPPYRIYVNQSIRLKKGSGSNIRPTTQALNNNNNEIQRQTINLPNNQTVNTVPKPVTPTPVPVVPTQPSAPVTAPSTSSNLRWVKPSNGAVIANYNLAQNIKGIRFGGNVGDPVLAAANGQVVYAADGLKEYGNLVLVKHVDGYITAYAHNSKILVKSGDNVTAGQKIAEMGSSGTTRTMLEFQVRLDGKPLNPANILPLF
ncbi:MULTISPECIES: peptidoglycan DD-metalloendopeptidase family protein [Acinetobacter]|uniref:Peptidoglycan DD-metalloendopeptidase family protein n=1 Tax=Acinetobacter piscicola TaxID=2006115 RepID=A0A7S7AI89_9GAMM|nr:MULTISPECIES: peptidoglycan DD-metalloendopeptidase family protein [Acinetobacter]MDM1757294.1 peptidoglycan DD-metalloendopeptidase family protein [Acinetobacter sp. 256-1]MDM1760286.1 peptidoglycan DD-metalloendopeptidase family protein [Acinetobacter sp. 251-1]QOW46744.1 peptidoglycan DD-metalloendopeptidase family protein [Acinetobacter piscicola]